MAAYTENGDMIATEGQLFRRVAWRINGGIYDGQLINGDEGIVESPHGSLTPLYEEVEN